jgi:hypothetical protein
MPALVNLRVHRIPFSTGMSAKKAGRGLYGH